MIMSAAVKLKNEGIPVIDVTYPTGGCEVPTCQLEFHLRDYLFTCLVDPKGTARKAFGLGEMDKIFLIGGDYKLSKRLLKESILLKRKA